jgi:hypothetical protein
MMLGIMSTLTCSVGSHSHLFARFLAELKATVYTRQAVAFGSALNRAEKQVSW